MVVKKKSVCFCEALKKIDFKDEKWKGKIYFVHDVDICTEPLFPGQHVYEMDKRGYQSFGISSKGFYKEFEGYRSELENKELMDRLLNKNQKKITILTFHYDKQDDIILLVLDPLNTEYSKLGTCSQCGFRPIYLINKNDKKKLCLDCSEKLFQGLIDYEGELWMENDLLDKEDRKTKFHPYLKDIHQKRVTIYKYGS